MKAIRNKSRNYNREQVIGELSEMGISVGKRIIVIPSRVYIGNKNWGKIDFLGIPWQRAKV